MCKIWGLLIKTVEKLGEKSLILQAFGEISTISTGAVEKCI